MPCGFLILSSFLQDKALIFTEVQAIRKKTVWSQDCLAELSYNGSTRKLRQCGQHRSRWVNCCVFNMLGSSGFLSLISSFLTYLPQAIIFSYFRMSPGRERGRYHPTLCHLLEDTLDLGHFAVFSRSELGSVSGIHVWLPPLCPFFMF